MARLMNKSSVKAIMNKRYLLETAAVGKKRLFTILGNGTKIDVKNSEGVLVQSVVEPGTVFQKVIFNLNAVSEIAMSNVRNHEYAAKGLAAERVGDYEAASKHFTDYLNVMQVSFSVATTNKILDGLGDNVDIEARVTRIDTDNGSILTIDETSIRVIKAEGLKKVTFAWDEEPTEDAPVVTEKAEDLLQA
jgi:hypothetical protein